MQQPPLFSLEGWMRTKHYRVALTDAERAELHLLVRRGQAPARVIRRAHILLEADADAFDHATARALHTSVATVWRLVDHHGSGAANATAPGFIATGGPYATETVPGGP